MKRHRKRRQNRADKAAHALRKLAIRTSKIAEQCNAVARSMNVFIGAIRNVTNGQKAK